MAENEPTGGNNLDDFFAKKDKSKKKTKSKFTVDDIQAKMENEDRAKKGKSKKREKDSNRPDRIAGIKVEGEDEEWNEVEEESEKDYTGLRIQNLQISAKGDEDRQDGGALRNEDGEDGEAHEATPGPWKPVNAGSATQSAPAPTPVIQQPPPPTVTETETPKTTGKYVPPAMRRMGGDGTPGSGSQGSGRSARSKKTAPNVNSQEDFPTLGSVAEPCEGPAFEKIRGGARQMEDPASHHSKLSLGNKFGALGAEDS